MVCVTKGEAVDGGVGLVLAFRQAGGDQIAKALSRISIPVVQQRTNVVFVGTKCSQVFPGRIQSREHHILFIVGQLAILVAVGNTHHQRQQAVGAAFAVIEVGVLDPLLDGSHRILADLDQFMLGRGVQHDVAGRGGVQHHNLTPPALLFFTLRSGVHDAPQALYQAHKAS
ncbi:hypothetical protein D3C76_355700 [compost metagenome]